LSKKTVSQSELNNWVDSVIQGQKTYGVKSKQDKFDYGVLENASQLKLEYDVTIRSPKFLFLPEVETIATFNREDAKYESEINNETFVVLGVHPYDMVAINQMDTIFSKPNWDEHYMTRRNNAIIVVADVQNPSKDVFAGYMGTAVVEDGFDVLITKIGNDAYLIDAHTEKGKQLIASLSEANDASDADIQARAGIWEENKKNLRKHELKVKPSQWPELLRKSVHHPVWEEKAKSCFSCGSCNLVCPTCYCFDIREDVKWDMKQGERIRTWDGCMLTDFATVAGPHNFRANRAERYRHRYYRKGSYVPEKLNGEIACVGCGRCINACVAKIANPVEIMNILAEEK
jgi:ferredoxin